MTEAETALTVNVIRTIWRVTAGNAYLRDACKELALDPNAIIPDQYQPKNRADLAEAHLEYPSYFCTREKYVLVLAHLVRRGVTFEVSLRQTRAGSDELLSFARIHPRLEEDIRRMLVEIDPRIAQQMADLNRRIELVFARLRARLAGRP